MLRLVGGFYLTIDGVPQSLTGMGERVVALLALRGGSAPRPRLAGELWPDRLEQRAVANLRSIVWRLPREVRRHLRSGTQTIAFDDAWWVDVTAAPGILRALRDGALDPADVPESHFRADLLSDCDEPWLTIERERYRQVRLHGLEELARLHLDAGRAERAVEAAHVALDTDPLRESAAFLLIRALVEEGNRHAALDQYRRFEKSLCSELGVEPSESLRALLEGVVD